MRHDLSSILGKELRFPAIETRACWEITQKEMGERLYMSESSYSDIDLMDIQEDPKEFLQKAERKIAEWYEKEMQPI